MTQRITAKLIVTAAMLVIASIASVFAAPQSIPEAADGAERDAGLAGASDRNAEPKLGNSDEITADYKRFVRFGLAFKPRRPGMPDLPSPERTANPKLKTEPPAASEPEVVTRFDWSSALKQSLVLLSIQHGYALTQPKTRSALRGPFVRDYFRSVGSLRGWADGGRFFTNYIAHPMQGSVTGFIQIHNDPKGKRLSFGSSKEYWQSRAKALAWSAIWSTQFEIGPLSQASLGNVGLSGKQTWVDIVITPTLGTALLIAEDAIDRYLIRSIENRSSNFYLKIFARMLLNPTRTMANLLRTEAPWRRDKGLR